MVALMVGLKATTLDSLGVRASDFVELQAAKGSWKQTNLGGGFKYFLFSPLFGEDFQFD